MTKRSTLSRPRKILTTLDTLIDKQCWQEAAELGETASQQDSEYHNLTNSAHFCFRMSLVYSLGGNDIMATVWWEEAKVAEGYSQQMEDDFRCDVALALIRRGQADDPLVNEYIKRSVEFNDLHGDRNRVAKAFMVRGRALYALGDFDHADQCFSHAHRQWLELGDSANKQWMRNNRFHWMRASSLLNHGMNARQQARMILKDRQEHATQRKYLAICVLLEPWLAAFLYDRFGHHKIR